MTGKLSQLKKVIQQANPEIMELKFGCGVLVIRDKEYKTLKKGSIEIVVKTSSARFGHLNVQVTLASGPTVTFLTSRLKVLGRPIRLADVLLAIRRKDLRRYCCDELGNILWYSSKGQILGGTVSWNLENDNLDHQSEETINFLHELLCLKNTTQ